MSESDAWGKLRHALVNTAAKLGSGVHIVRIESTVGAGVFDTNICYKGHEFWLEGKFIKQLPVKDTTPVKVGMSEEQWAFALRRFYAGGTCYLWANVQLNRRSGDEGWYIFELNNVDIINDVRRGMKLPEFLTHRHPHVDGLAAYLLTLK